VKNFPEIAHGADVAFANDVPSAAGMSTSSALIVAIFLGVAHATRIVGHARYREAMPALADVAAYASTLENGQTYKFLAGDTGVGTAGGSQDHTAILCARPSALVQYAFCPVRHEQTVSLPADLTFVIGVSGVHAEKIGCVKDAYNRLPLMVRDLVARWNGAMGREAATLDDVLGQAGGGAELAAWIAQTVDDAGLRGEWTRRVEQFAAEAHAIIPEAASALARGDLAAFGGLVDRSQSLADTHLGNQVVETVDLARFGRESGAVAASSFGAGFGGGVWAMVPRDEIAAFTARWRAAYLAAHPARADRAVFFQTDAGPGAFAL
jgi:galactokinase